MTRRCLRCVSAAWALVPGESSRGPLQMHGVGGGSDSDAQDHMQSTEYIRRQVGERCILPLCTTLSVPSAGSEYMTSAFGGVYENHPRTAIINLPLSVTPVCGKTQRRGYALARLREGYPQHPHARHHGQAEQLFLHMFSARTKRRASGIRTPSASAKATPSRHRPEPRRQSPAHRRRLSKPRPPAPQTRGRAETPRALYIAVAPFLPRGSSATGGSSTPVTKKRSARKSRWRPPSHDRPTHVATAISRVYTTSSAPPPLFSGAEMRFPTALADLPLGSPEATDVRRSYYPPLGAHTPARRHARHRGTHVRRPVDGHLLQRRQRRVYAEQRGHFLPARPRWIPGVPYLGGEGEKEHQRSSRTLSWGNCSRPSRLRLRRRRTPTSTPRGAGGGAAPRRRSAVGRISQVSPIGMARIQNKF